MAGETSLLIGVRIVPATALLTCAATAGILWSRHSHGNSGRKKTIRGLAKPADIEPLLAKAITAKAKSLRPSLKDTRHIAAADTGGLLRTLQGTHHEVRMGLGEVGDLGLIRCPADSRSAADRPVRQALRSGTLL